jgi:hypothetical protein
MNNLRENTEPMSRPIFFFFGLNFYYATPYRMPRAIYIRQHYPIQLYITSLLIIYTPLLSYYSSEREKEKRKKKKLKTVNVFDHERCIAVGPSKGTCEGTTVDPCPMLWTNATRLTPVLCFPRRYWQLLRQWIPRLAHKTLAPTRDSPQRGNNLSQKWVIIPIWPTVDFVLSSQWSIFWHSLLRSGNLAVFLSRYYTASSLWHSPGSL